MSPPRAPPLPVAPRADGRGLLNRYRALLTRHEALVRRLEARTTQQVTAFQLSHWALETSASALAVLHPGGVVLANSRWHALGRVRGPWRQVAQAGAPVLLSILDVGQAEVAAVLARENGGPHVTRYQQVRGARPQVLEVRSERVVTPHGDQVLVLARDITDQTRDEEELARARAILMSREQLRALGELTAGLAHDLRNTLGAMQLHLKLLERDEPLGARGRGHVETLGSIVSDAAARVGRLQDFMRHKPGESREQAQLGDVVREAVEVAWGSLQHEDRGGRPPLKLVLTLPRELPRVAGSPMELRYVIINLLINARDAMPQGGTLHVRALKVGRSVRVRVEDEGTGIPEEHLPHLFQAFFTTKGSQGTGLGLAMAHGVVTRAGGTLTAANRPEGGAVFTLSLPALKPPPARRKPRAR